MLLPKPRGFERGYKKTSNRPAKQAYQQGMKMYGYVPLLMLLEHYEREELYEDCQAIVDAIQDSAAARVIERANEIAIKNGDTESIEPPLPTRIYDGMYEDYLQAFWRTGNGGQAAFSNLQHYCAEIIELALNAE